MDFDAANLAREAADMLGRMLLPRCSVGQPAIGTAEIFGGPYAACHARNYAKQRPRFPARPFTMINDLSPKRLKS